jgi:orotidine-5'-phosphate decarboxylase
MEGKERIIVALDVDSVDKAIELVEKLSPHVGYFKIGLELIYTILASLITPENETEAIETLRKVRQLFELLEGNVFIDAKLADIPNTVAGASKAIAKLGAEMFNVHASIGEEALKQAVANCGVSSVLGVTVLTSIGKEECISIFGAEPSEKVVQFAKMLAKAGAHGIVCSPKELELLSDPELETLYKVTPGVRPLWAAKGDQKRVMTPYEAIIAGADFLVIGRPITQPPPEIGSPVEAAKKIAEEIEKALEHRKILEKIRKILEIEEGQPEELLKNCNAIWIYSGKEGEPHALLASGKHSDGYINLNAVLQFPNLCQILAHKLIEKLKAQGITREKIDAVASSSFAAITFGQEVARQLNVLFVFTEKEGDEQKWSGRFELPKGCRILQVEELVTTLGTTEKVKKAILEKNPDVRFLEIDGKTVVATIFHRPDRLPIDYPHYKVIALIEKEIHNWDPNECPLCQKGSEALKPKQNWQKFLEYQ